MTRFNAGQIFNAGCHLHYAYLASHRADYCGTRIEDRERHIGKMLEELRKAADVLECDLIEREQKVVSIRGTSGEAA